MILNIMETRPFTWLKAQDLHTYWLTTQFLIRMILSLIKFKRCLAFTKQQQINTRRPGKCIPEVNLKVLELERAG